MAPPYLPFVGSMSCASPQCRYSNWCRCQLLPPCVGARHRHIAPASCSARSLVSLICVNTSIALSFVLASSSMTAIQSLISSYLTSSGSECHNIFNIDSRCSSLRCRSSASVHCSGQRFPSVKGYVFCWRNFSISVIFNMTLQWASSNVRPSACCAMVKLEYVRLYSFRFAAMNLVD